MGRLVGLRVPASSTRRLALVLVALAFAACRREPPPRQYPIEGQVLAVHAERQELTIKHGDIPGLMPAMTMTFGVSSPLLLRDRKPGELVTGTLEVGNDTGRIVAIAHAGEAPLPADSNEAAMAGAVLAEGDEVPDAAFIDQSDRRRSFSEWRGSPTLVTFIYTRCPLPNFCPLMDRHFATLQKAIMADAALRGRSRLVSISFDPDYDTPSVLAAHAARYGADPSVWTLLTGDRVTVDRFAARFGVGVLRQTGEAEITHNLRTILIGADGRVVRIYSGNDWTPSGVLADMRRLVR